jgi:hypothetical protein
MFARMLHRGCLIAWLVVFAVPALRGDVVINEIQFDDSAVDDREFVELFNAGTTPVDIGGWVLRGNDPSGSNIVTTIPATTTLAPAAFYVIGNAGVPDVNQIAAGGFLENDNESVELYDAGNILQDAVVYEANKGLSDINGIGSILPEVGPGYWGNHQGVDIGTFQTLTTVGRHVDGHDTNNNGRDFGLRPGTPGTSNHSAGFISEYIAPNVDGLANGSGVPGLTGSVVGARAITPGSVSASLNLNSIPSPPGFSKAIVAWDGSGGGNAVVSNAVFNNGGTFNIQVYLDTDDLPGSVNAAGIEFVGTEETFYGIGSIDSFVNLADISNGVTLPPTIVSSNGATGIAWYYEKSSESPGGDPVSEKLYLVDANDGGNSNADAPDGLDWRVLTTIDLSAEVSGWHKLSISIDPYGFGTATFDDQTFPFTTVPGFTGEFYIGYRENTQSGSSLTPSYLRPPTFADVPEPSALALCALATVRWSRRRRS